MDFIDEFIQEYKKNQCLWKTDSAHFKNRSKRQEAYYNLIDVAGKHGEYYNIERTKQKINNLRCAFRHQLKKCMEAKSKGVKDEPYCPKRRYFESLMFLKDEENIDRKTARSNSSECKTNAVAPKDYQITPQPSEENIILQTYQIEPQCTNEVDKYLGNSYKASPTSDATIVATSSDIPCSITSTRIFPTIEPLQSTTPAAIIESVPPVTVHRKSNDNLNFYVVGPKDTETIEKNSPRRKRSLSSSSQHSNVTEGAKAAKTSCTSNDLENLVSLLCKSSEQSDHFTYFGKIVAHKLRSMEPTQAMYSEKIITDIIFQGQLKQLTLARINQLFNIDGKGITENPTQSCGKNNEYS